MKDYIIIIRPLRGHEFYVSPTEDEIKAMQNHFAYLQDLTKKGIVQLAGPCEDESFGVIILKAENDEEAKRIIENDSSIKANVMSYEIHPLRIALKAV